MASFRDVQEAFRKNETSDFCCVAMTTRGHPRVRCEERLTDAQKDKLTGLLHTDKHQLHLNEVRTIIWELLCTYHRAKERQYAFEKRIESRWYEEFPNIDFRARRSPSRKSGISNPSTPTPQRPSSNGSFSQPSLIPSRPPAIQHERDLEPGASSRPQPASDVDFQNIFDSIETTSEKPISPRDRESSEVIEPSACFEEENKAVEQEGVDFENGITDQPWGDSSVAGGGEISSRRRLHIYHLETGKVDKAISKQETTPKLPTESQGEHEEGPEIPAPPANVTPPGEIASIAGSNHRSSLSPEHGTRASPYPKSRTRSRGSRSPSAPPITDRGILAFASMEGDAMYDRLPRDNEENVVKLLQKRLAYTDKQTSGKPGWVYAIRDPELDLVKIGFSTRGKPGRTVPGGERLREFQGVCQLSSAAYMINDASQVPVLAFKRLEALVHADLRPHRWYYECACGFKKKREIEMLHNTEHHEWYEITNGVAIDTINLWRDFILRNPYGHLQRGEHHALKDEWVQQLRSRPGVAAHEEHEHHQKRLQRWESLWQHTPPPATKIPTSTTSQTAATESTFGELQNIKAEDPDIPKRSLEDVPAYAPEISSSAPPQTNPHFAINGEHHSLRTTPAISTASVSRSSSQGVREMRSHPVGPPVAPFHQTLEAISQYTPLPQIANPDLTARQRANGVNVYDFAESKFGLVNILSSLDAFLREERKGLSSRSACNDLYTFRWPFSTAVTLALCSSYVPPLLSAFMWVLFLPFFVAELREWQ